VHLLANVGTFERNVNLRYACHAEARDQWWAIVNTERNPQLHMWLIICWAAERLLAPQERRCSAKLVHICSVGFLL